MMCVQRNQQRRRNIKIDVPLYLKLPTFSSPSLLLLDPQPQYLQAEGSGLVVSWRLEAGAVK